VCATFTLQSLSKNAAHGMISFTGVHNYENRDWLMQLPFILINAGMSRLLDCRKMLPTLAAAV
jgi:chloride channel 7